HSPVPLLNGIQHFEEDRQTVSRNATSCHNQPSESVSFEQAIHLCRRHRCLLTKLMKDSAKLGLRLPEVGECEIDVDRLIVVTFLRTRRLPGSIRIQYAGMPKCRDLEVQWKILAESMHIVQNERLIYATQMVEVVNLDEHGFDCIRQAKELTNLLLKPWQPDVQLLELVVRSSVRPLQLATVNLAL